MNKPIAISIGDINGIGAEIVLKALKSFDLTHSTPVILSPKSVVEFYAKTFDFDPEYVVVSSVEEIKPGVINVLDLWDIDIQPVPGVQNAFGGKTAMESIEHAIRLTKEQTTKAMVTAPISKEAVNLAGYKIPGHTEFLAEQCGVESVLMMLVTKELRVALVTTHVPIADVAKHISEVGIIEKLELLDYSLKNDFGIETPEISVFGLNPHAGDGGVIGTEEIDIITPTLQTAKAMGYNVTGPHPADGFFGQQAYKHSDAILAMYHDQGLAPFKLLSFGSGVNFTAGLPIIRTSPDHGTAFNIAGKNQANPSSFTEAYELAVQLVEKRFGS